ncbi:MltA domain-containing protein [Phenylobacterium sp. J367]|uniref:MltA domain-containing protein n=1 Tax=Phenylobacterium sp. J367 TaxID=2898435 RepID=UPI0021509EA9|nr:MltA domain-containing protein [Phenylobacterium sp. J367]MCR5878119.1 MltA domain-containing protein [Phenylobacterium sp. J367]
MRAAGAALLALTVAACATPKYEPQPGPRPGVPPFPRPGRPESPRPEPTKPPLRVLELSELPGWAADNHAEAFAAYRATCQAAQGPAFARLCRQAKAAPPLGSREARAFFEANFRALETAGEGVLTAYFAPEYPARAVADEVFSAPVRPKPADLVNGQPYAARDEIEARPADDALAWMRPEDLFFLQIQGSGVLTFEDGRRMKALYAANNGLPFVGIANPMRERGLLARDNTSGEAIRGWLAAHAGPEADEIMRLNPRYAFFRLAPDDGRQPAGSAGIPLPPGRAIAVDLTRHSHGELHWISAEAPMLAGAFPTYRRLVTALDTGGAIKGEVRADLYLGLGAEAGTEAGRVRHTLRMYRLIPREPGP